LSGPSRRVKLGELNVKPEKLLAAGLMIAFAVTRWPGFFPEEWASFSAAYAICFCAGVYFSRAVAWWLPLLTLFVSDIFLNIFYYHTAPITVYMLPNYVMYGALVALGRLHSGKKSWWRLVFGGAGGAVLFFLVTNTVAWLQNEKYPKTWAGWLAAMTTGIPGWPPPWVFLRNSFLSGGLFTGLFAAAMKLTASSESEFDKEPVKAGEEEEEQAPVPEPEKADA
jgi:hypothetical protein